MDKKSFIRGFGAGVLFAAVILGISFLVRTSDSFVTSRARQLGMVYADKSEDKGALTKETPKAETSPDVQTSQMPNESAAPTEDNKSSNKNTSKSEKTPVATEVAKSSNVSKEDVEEFSDVSKSLKKEKEEVEKEVLGEKKKLTIDVGDWSLDVSQKLEDLGIVDSASDFDSYLNKNGYSYSINAGEYKVSVDDTYEELAKKITSK